MAHGTRVNGTAYGVTGGKCLVGGTGYKIKKGRTLIAGTGYDITFGTPLAAYAEGDIVKINENGVPFEFLIGKHNYESGLNGIGRTLILRKNLFDERMWAMPSSDTKYAGSLLDTWFNGEYKNLLDDSIKSAMGTTKIYCTNSFSDQSIITIDRSIFALSGNEFGLQTPGTNNEGSPLPIAEEIRDGYLNGRRKSQSTRTLFLWENNYTAVIYQEGGYGLTSCTTATGSRPAFTLPESIIVGADGIIR